MVPYLISEPEVGFDSLQALPERQEVPWLELEANTQNGHDAGFEGSRKKK